MKDKFSGDLFAIDKSLSILRIGSNDVETNSDKFKLFSGLISKHDDMYPGIEVWLKRKALPGIRNKSRVAYLLLGDDEPVASAMVKLGERSKFCHLHIDESQRERHLGELFFSLMAIDAKRHASEVHFTVPESLWTEKKAFFKSFGFENALKAHKQYRKNEDEFICSASFDVVWKNALKKLPKIIDHIACAEENIFNGLLMSIKPQYLEKIMSGEKIVEVRKSFSRRWEGSRLTLYSSSPRKAIVGHAEVLETYKDRPEVVWEKYGEHIGCSKEDFDEYTDNEGTVCAIILGNCEKYINEISLDQLSYLLNKNLRPPQSHLSLKDNDDWKLGISIAEILHGRFRLYESTFLR